MKTKFGNASLNSSGHFRIHTKKEGNYSKLLHRLIYENYYGEIPEGYDVHHIDGNKQNNCILNLVLVKHGEHSSFHKIGKNRSSETKSKISKSLIGVVRDDSSKIKQSNTTNTTRYFRVYKQKAPQCKQGFMYNYRYYENGKRKAITSVDLDKLKEKVLAKGLEWIEFDTEDSE